MRIIIFCCGLVLLGYLVVCGVRIHSLPKETIGVEDRTVDPPKVFKFNIPKNFDEEKFRNEVYKEDFDIDQLRKDVLKGAFIKEK